MSHPHINSFYKVADINIENYPEIDELYTSDKASQLSIGDLHGNALKLLFTLIKHGIFKNITKKDYQAFVKLYKKPVEAITKTDLKWLNKLLNKAQVNNAGTLRLIGDELADRGSNDYFTLKILNKLFQNNVNVEILISNHSYEFIEAYEKGETYISNRLMYGQARSMLNVFKLLEKKLISRKEVDELVAAYLPHLKALSYTINLDNQQIAIFTHAPVGIEHIRLLAEKLNVSYNDSSITKLAQTIERINTVFTEEYVNTKKIHTLFIGMDNGRDPSTAHPKKLPFVYLAWNREHNINRPADFKGYKLMYIHGHDIRDINISHICNLDNILGKDISMPQGPYHVHFTHEVQLSSVYDIGSAIKNRYSFLNSIKNIVRKTINAPSQHLFLTATLGASLILLTAYALAMTAAAIAMQLLVVAGITSILKARNSLFARWDKKDEENSDDLPFVPNTHSIAYQDGLEAAKGWLPYAQSFKRKADWLEYREFGIGYNRGLRNYGL